MGSTHTYRVTVEYGGKTTTDVIEADTYSVGEGKATFYNDDEVMIATYPKPLSVVRMDAFEE